MILAYVYPDRGEQRISLTLEGVRISLSLVDAEIAAFELREAIGRAKETMEEDEWGKKAG